VPVPVPALGGRHGRTRPGGAQLVQQAGAGLGRRRGLRDAAGDDPRRGELSRRQVSVEFQPELPASPAPVR
jgi:hypothetical protein